MKDVWLPCVHYRRLMNEEGAVPCVLYPGLCRGNPTRGKEFREQKTNKKSRLISAVIDIRIDVENRVVGG